jgi:hypothetical protein
MSNEQQRAIDLHFARIHEKIDNLHARHLGSTSSMVAEQKLSGHEAGHSTKEIIDEQHTQAVEIANLKLELGKLHQALAVVTRSEESKNRRIAGHHQSDPAQK